MLRSPGEHLGLWTSFSITSSNMKPECDFFFLQQAGFHTGSNPTAFWIDSHHWSGRLAMGMATCARDHGVVTDTAQLLLPLRLHGQSGCGAGPS